MPEEKWRWPRAQAVSLPWDFSLKTWAMDPLLTKQIKQGCVWALCYRKMKSWLRWRLTLRSAPSFLALFLFLRVIDLLQRQMAHADRLLSDATTQNLAPSLTPNLWREKRSLERDKQRADLGKQKMVVQLQFLWEWCISPQFIYLGKEGDVCVMWSISGLFREHSVPDHRLYQSHSSADISTAVNDTGTSHSNKNIQQFTNWKFI